MFLLMKGIPRESETLGLTSGHEKPLLTYVSDLNYFTANYLKLHR